MFPGASDPKKLGGYLTLAQVGTEMVVPIVLGIVLDYGLGCAPWGVVIGAILGLVGGMFHLIVLQKPSGPPANTRDGQ